MSPLSTLLTTLPLLLVLATALPTTLNTRDDRPSMSWACGPHCSHMVYDPDQATCGGEKSLQHFSTGVAVTVRPDCDNVINTICQAAEKLANASPAGHVEFGPYGSWLRRACALLVVRGRHAFQSITESCMVVGGPSDHNSASVGKQFGVRNVMYKAVDGGDDWLAGTSYQQTTPGYLIGPNPSVWGTTNWGSQKEAADVLSAPA